MKRLAMKLPVESALAGCSAIGLAALAHPLCGAILLLTLAILIFLAQRQHAGLNAPADASGAHDQTEGNAENEANSSVPFQAPTNLPNQDWVEHAYPLQQITIELQGTRHSDSAAVIAQLETVLARLKAGETFGLDHDDDFGYRFRFSPTARTASFFDEPAGRA